MDHLSAGETILLGLLRGVPETEFTLSVTLANDGCVVTLTNSTDGVLVGHEPTFDQALVQLAARSSLLRGAARSQARPPIGAGRGH